MSDEAQVGFKTGPPFYNRVHVCRIPLYYSGVRLDG
jgi:hypothetical protein